MLAPFLAFYAGLVAFAALLLLRRAAPRWTPLPVLAAIGVELAGPMRWKARLCFVLLTAAFAGLARLVWRPGAVAWAGGARPPVPAAPGA